MDRIIEPETHDEDESLDTTLRPRELKDYVGQDKVKENLGVLMAAAKKRGESIEHVLLYGSPGLGKTTLAHIIAREMNSNIRVTSGPALAKAGDLAAILTNLQEGDVLFIDEIHRLNKTIEEILYPAMEEFALDLIIGKGPSARTLRLDLPKFSIVGATTKVSLLSAPLRDRFGATYRLNFYEPEDIEQILRRSAKILGVRADDEALKAVAERSRRTPRIANRLLKRVRDVADVKGDGTITPAVTEAAWDMLDVDLYGLDEVDRRILETIIEKFGGGPVGVATLAAATAEETATIEDVYEPFLMQIGFLQRTPRGRVVTEHAYRHLKIDPPDDLQQRLL
ncbi:Holliday junction branch migration DNA helicase RuvB [Candidatus Uhrbacteria bacterium CG10_big_fil_rev_8_21_14_0_10_48_11]|uniref:Holliday junction branch migration complex subunit RuvB n=1 Tax=Candidatus Uhrbacteria bacterium CG10_big_fil_rev_8_21_14_0_10_48_11 TaxID=1975037 RepID=A0A2M8LES8_9BACT|nr:MAG: Holliday junction branch migration DNA helicase RuvB [Candidatus Uhrbacteria bacterium CG10_big_fil_rev_8_21_14_0_10_48_11]